MAHLKIDYGIDLGTTNSSICRMEKGVPTIVKSDTSKEIMPSCISCNKKGSLRVGDPAYNTLKSESKQATKTWKQETNNTFIEFKRTMGTDTRYESSNMNRSFSSEELSAEVLKTLKSFVLEETIESAVITVPAKFTISQKDATVRAARLAGFKYCVLLQEPIAASMAYGLKSDEKNGYWMVFDFGGGTFDAALLRVEDGIMQVFDTEGDSYLGGKDLDFAIVDNLIIPQLKNKFSIEKILNDPGKRQILRNAMKPYAEDLKNQLSFKRNYDIISNIGDLGEDDEGNELEIDLTITQNDLEKVFDPLFQKAIDICNLLLQRNNMSGEQLSSLILVGGPTHSPILRRMLREQITQKVKTDVDPMTVVACGAALYASTSNNEVTEELALGTLAFDLEYDASTVDTSTYIPIKLNRQKSNGNIPNKIYVELVRGDSGWSSRKMQIDEKGNIIEVFLSEGKANLFNIIAYNELGSKIQCFPKEITIIQGSKIGSVILPYGIGIEIFNNDRNRSEYTSIKGLEKNKPLPATGITNGLKTLHDLRPGKEDDMIKIPIYQGSEGADGLSAANFLHVYDAIINGANLPSFLPEGSDVEIILKVDMSESVTMEVNFPSIDYSEEILVPRDTVQKEVSANYLQNEISKATVNLNSLQEEGEDISKPRERLGLVQNELNNGDSHDQILNHLRQVLVEIDKIETEGEWTRMEKYLRKNFTMLENDNHKYGDKETVAVEQIRSQVDDVIRRKDISSGKVLKGKMFQLNFKIAAIEYYAAWIFDWDDNFTTLNWKDTSRARTMINQGLQLLDNAPTEEKLRPIIRQLISLLPSNQVPIGSIGLLGKQ